MAAASSSLTFSALQKQIAARQLAPVYMLHGEEGYYIDELTKAFENVTPDDEKDFNQYIFYGGDANPDVVMEACRRYPMMADRVVVILKEAQSMRADQLNKFAKYLESPQPSTTFVISFRGEKAKGKDLLAAVRKCKAAVFESARLNDKSIVTVINDLVKERGLNIEQRGLTMLRDYIGADASKLNNEIDKLAMILGRGAMITPEAIERNIGISKNYNVRELVQALFARNSSKAYAIVNYFRANPKSNSPIMVVASMFPYFANLLTMQFVPERTPRAMMAACGFHSEWQMRFYEDALRNYNAFQSMEIISEIRKCDVRCKGVGSRLDPFDLLKNLIFRILTTPGEITI